MARIAYVYMDAARCLYLSHVQWPMCLFLSVLRKNGRTDRDTVLEEDTCRPKKPFTRWGPDPSWEGAP